MRSYLSSYESRTRLLSYAHVLYVVLRTTRQLVLELVLVVRVRLYELVRAYKLVRARYPVLLFGLPSAFCFKAACTYVRVELRRTTRTFL